MHRGVHSRLHRIEIMNLVHQFCIIVRNHERVHGSENNRDIRAHRVHGALTKIKKPGKALWSDIQGSSALLHLLVAALHCICSFLRCIVESLHVKEAITTSLTVYEQDVHTLVMVASDSVLEHLTTQIAGGTRGVAQPHPGITWIRSEGEGISLDAKYRFWAESRGCCSRRVLRCTTDLNLARGQQYTTNQNRGKNN